MTDHAGGMKRYLNVGAGPGWESQGWQTLDHKVDSLTAWRTGCESGYFDIVFSSHVIEHISHWKIDAVFKEWNRILKIGGGVRVLCPDMGKFAHAYVSRDEEFFREMAKEETSLRTDLGMGGTFMNIIVSHGVDNIMLSRNGEIAGGYAHVYGYDYDMIRILLERHGFGEIRKCEFLDSDFEVLREPLRPLGSPPVWVNEPEWPKNHYRTTGFDRDPLTSLIVEAKKVSESDFSIDEFGKSTRHGLNPTGFPALFRR